MKSVVVAEQVASGFGAAGAEAVQVGARALLMDGGPALVPS